MKKIHTAPCRASIRRPFPTSPGKLRATRNGRRAGHRVARGELATDSGACAAWNQIRDDEKSEDAGVSPRPRFCFSARVIPNPGKHCVPTIGVILREAPRETVFRAQGQGADRRIFFGNGRGSSRQTLRSRQDGAPIGQILRSAHRHWCSWRGPGGAFLRMTPFAGFVSVFFLRIRYDTRSGKRVGFTRSNGATEKKRCRRCSVAPLLCVAILFPDPVSYDTKSLKRIGHMSFPGFGMRMRRPTWGPRSRRTSRCRRPAAPPARRARPSGPAAAPGAAPRCAGCRPPAPARRARRSRASTPSTAATPSTARTATRATRKGAPAAASPSTATSTPASRSSRARSPSSAVARPEASTTTKVTPGSGPVIRSVPRSVSAAAAPPPAGAALPLRARRQGERQKEQPRHH